MTEAALPTAFGRYQVLSLLGTGGMSLVYQARDPVLDRLVAVKVMPGVDVNNRLRRERFRRDARLLAKLEHPAIVPIHDFGEQEGVPYLVMSHMPGGSLHDRLDRGRLSAPQARPILVRLAAALDFVHDNQVLHRDLKPGNVLFDGSGAACLSDFGIARLLTQDSRLTQEHLPGTPAYMSPEQALNQPLTPASDLYSFGVLVYETLSGVLPFEAITVDELLRCHAETPPLSLHGQAPELPAAVDGVIFRALAKAPDERYPSATALVQALEQALDGGGAPEPASGEYVCARCGYPVPGANAPCPVCGGSGVKRSPVR